MHVDLLFSERKPPNLSLSKLGGRTTFVASAGVAEERRRTPPRAG
jgi:hypothetical protein